MVEGGGLVRGGVSEGRGIGERIYFFFRQKNLFAVFLLIQTFLSALLIKSMDVNSLKPYISTFLFSFFT